MLVTPTRPTQGVVIPMPNQYTYASVEERFWAKVDKNGPIPSHAPHLGPCWLWTSVISRESYGLFYFGPRRRQRQKLAHVMSYEMAVGPKPVGLILDHLCRVRACVRPTHLEAVTDRVNILRGVSVSARNARKERCLRGHEFEPQRTNRGQRICKTCINMKERERRLKARATCDRMLAVLDGEAKR